MHEYNLKTLNGFREPTHAEHEKIAPYMLIKVRKQIRDIWYTLGILLFSTIMILLGAINATTVGEIWMFIALIVLSIACVGLLVMIGKNAVTLYTMEDYLKTRNYFVLECGILADEMDLRIGNMVNVQIKVGDGYCSESLPLDEGTVQLWYTTGKVNLLLCRCANTYTLLSEPMLNDVNNDMEVEHV